MTLTPGTRLGAFDIVALVGAGGMGEVYRARDTRLDRTVALKILSEAGLDASPRRLERFRQEARAIARITHPNICTLHDVSQEGSTTFLVMEFLEGTTLARRLEEGPLPLATALKIAIQIADALDHAHRQGVVHRDLKPSNVMLARDRVKLLDFGLAKLKEPDERAAVGAATATQLTDAHTIVGTLPYMAPEQIEGREVDARTDIFAFGIVLYEMIAGRRPFAGDSRVSLMSAIVAADVPSLSGLQPRTPPALERLVTRCLSKDPDDRWQTARDLASELRWIAAGDSTTGLAAPPPARRREAVAWTAAIVFALVALFAGVVAVRRSVMPTPTAAVTRFTVAPAEGTAIAALGVGGSPLSVSPDGRHIAFLAVTPDGNRRLFLRSLDGVDARPLAGTSGAQHLFWSPDSESIGFVAGGKLQRISIAGGDPRTICDLARGGGGASWNRDDVIVLATGFGGEGLLRVSAGGGTPTAVTTLDRENEYGHISPSFLPDGRHVVFLRIGGEQSGLHVCAIDSCKPKLLLRTDLAAGDIPSMAVFAPPRYLVFARRGVVLAQPFDLERLELTGDAFRVAEGVDNFGPSAAFSVSQNGVLIYWSGGLATTQLTWVDRTGRSVGTAGAPGSYIHVAVSPDGTRVALDGSGASDGIRVLDLARGGIARIASDVNAYSPVWSPDGDAILYAAVSDFPPNLFVKRLSAPGDAERLLRTPIQHFPTHWSPDGKSAVYQIIVPETKADLWVMPMPGGGEPTPFLQTPVDEMLGRISPDGRWIAYQSDESGRYEVYVTSYPQPGRKSLVSVNGGTMPVWRKDGVELFYVSADRKLTAVPVRLGATVEPGVPAPLFEYRAVRVQGFGAGWTYDVAPDGRFLINIAVERPPPPLTVVVNWPAAVEKN